MATATKPALLRVLYFAPGRGPEERTVANTLPALQALVDGYLEPVRFPGGLVLLVNEEGKLRNLPGNRTVDRIGFVYGAFFFVRTRGAEFASLSDADVTAAKDLVWVQR